MLADLTDELDAMLHMERDPAATNMAWKKKLKNKRTKEKTNTLKKKTTSKNYDDYCSLFFLRNSNVLPSINLATLTITKKKLLVIPYSPFFPKLTYTQKKIPLLLTHSFLIIIPLLQRNDAYWIMYLKKERKNTQKDDCHNPQKLKQSIGDSLCLLQNYYTL